MSNRDFERFRELVLADTAMQDRLRVPIERGDFIEIAAETAAENGIDLTNDDIEEALRAGRRDWIERWI